MQITEYFRLKGGKRIKMEYNGTNPDDTLVMTVLSNKDGDVELVMNRNELNDLVKFINVIEYST